MDIVKIFTEGIQKEVNAIFYLYNSLYYFIYTEKEIDANGYVVLHVSKVVKEIKSTEDGPLETGWMVGVEITDQEEWKQVQTSISEIVEDKKNNTVNPKIQYLPVTMITSLKIMSKKTFRLVKDIIENDFKLQFVSSEIDAINSTPIPIVPTAPVEPVAPIVPVEPVAPSVDIEPLPGFNELENESNKEPIQAADSTLSNDVIIDYRTKFFEEQEKNKVLETELENMKNKLENIKGIIE